MKIYEYSCTVELSAQVESFFSQNVLNPTLMNRGFAALLSHNHDFFTYPIRLPKLTLLDLSDFEQRWGELLSLLQAGDVVQIFNSSSILSRMIATVEQGCWSHSAIYTGEGTVLEAITSGVSERPLTMYKNRVIHLGVYRNLNLSQQQAATGIKWNRTQIGKPYAWRKVSVLALQKTFGLYRNDRLPGPNDLIVQSDLCLIITI